MDYDNGTHLAQWQWRSIHDPAVVKGLFKRDESSEWTTDGHYYLFTYLGMLMGMEDYATAEQYGKWAEEPDTRVISEGDMQENITWLIGGLQQRNHALTGGYHGVELAATAYAITHYFNKKSEAISMYLLHRFGDVFAHYKINQDINNYGSIPLKDYCSKLESYFNSKLANINFIEPNIDYFISSGEVIRLADNGVYTEEDDVYTSMTKEEVIWQMLLSIFRAADNPLILPLDPDTKINALTLNKWNTFTYSVMNEEILKVLPNATQNSFDMYGDDSGANCWSIAFTIGHAGQKNVNVDNILARIPLFKYYVRNAIELFKTLQDSGYIQKSENVSTDDVYKEICGVVDAAEKASNGDVSLKLDGIWALHIYLKRLEKGEKIKSFVLPIKYLTSKTRQLDRTVSPIYKYIFRWNTTNEDWRDIDGSVRIREFLSHYLEYCRQNDLYKFNNIKTFEMTDNGTSFTIKPITE